MIAEFIGAPGVGKSTICHRVMERIQSQGYSAINLHRDELRKGALTRKLYSLQALCGPYNRALRAAVRTYEEANRNPQSSVWMRDLLISALKLDKSYVEAYDLACFEEGPAQYLSSIAHMKEMDAGAEAVISQMNRTVYAHDITAFYISADRDEIMGRLKERNKKNDRFTGGDDKDIGEALRIKTGNLEYLLTKLDFREIYRIDNHDIDKAVDEAYSIISRNIKRVAG